MTKTLDQPLKVSIIYVINIFFFYYLCQSGSYGVSSKKSVPIRSIMSIPWLQKNSTELSLLKCSLKISNKYPLLYFDILEKLIQTRASTPMSSTDLLEYIAYISRDVPLTKLHRHVEAMPKTVAHQCLEQLCERIYRNV